MSETPPASAENRVREALDDAGASRERALRNFRYVVASVNDSALSAWADLWNQLQGNVASNGMVTPGMEQGFSPACGWPEFLEKLWLLKHYLDYIHRFCKE
jgi:hypothetical protein